MLIRFARYFSKMANQVHGCKKFTGIRLPSDVKPVHYDLRLKPDLSRFTFQGQVRISYKASSVVDCITLHSTQIEISDGSIDDSNPLVSVGYNETTETVCLDFAKPIATEGSLLLNFSGVIDDKMKGLYRTGFKIGDKTVHAATTQFEATDARRCFPCWDEPAIKATFTVRLIIPKWIVADEEKFECLALSNMPEVLRSCTGDELDITFDKTPVMSTYLLAMVVGPFEMIESTDGRRPIRVYTTPGKKEQGRFALEVACKSLSYYENYFNIDYPLPKMDLIAIPDFSSGAMENWGLVTYRESCVLVDPKNTATKVKQYVAIVVAHELAHQWFGNLVTMEWWTHLWLNEGFASFMEYLCVDHIFPEYDIWSQFVTDAHGRALNLDSLQNSHPIEVPVKNSSEIDEIFDDISYSKGASIIRMLYNFIGDDSFRKGMNDYLTKFAYKNASTEHLWDSLEAASKKPVRKLMDCWTSQKGYPWLAVESAADGDDVSLTLTQNKFTADGSVSDGDSSMLWMVPISAITAKNPTQVQELCLLEGRSTKIAIKGAGSDWIKLNPGTIDFYRAAYTTEMIKRLVSAIQEQTLPAMDRLGIQNDYFALCKAGKVSTVDLLELLRSYKSETVYPVWSSIDSCMGYLKVLLSNIGYDTEFSKFGCELYSSILERCTWAPKAGEKHTDALTRALVIDRLVSFGHPDVVKEATRRFRAHIDGTETVPADIRGACYRAVSMHGNRVDFEDLLKIYRNSDLHEEKDRVLRALGFTKDSERLKEIVDFTFSDEVRNQDKVFALIPIGSSNPEFGWKTLCEKKEILCNIYEKGHLLPYVVKYLTISFASEEKAEEVAKFFAANKFPGTERTVQQSLETIRLNANWLKRDGESVKRFLDSCQYPWAE